MQKNGFLSSPLTVPEILTVPGSQGFTVPGWLEWPLPSLSDPSLPLQMHCCVTMGPRVSPALLTFMSTLYSAWTSLVAQSVKNLTAVQETWVRLLDQERSAGEGNGKPLQHPCLENPLDRGAWWAAVPGLQSQTWLNDFTVFIRLYGGVGR